MGPYTRLFSHQITLWFSVKQLGFSHPAIVVRQILFVLVSQIQLFLKTLPAIIGSQDWYKPKKTIIVCFVQYYLIIKVVVSDVQTTEMIHLVCAAMIQDIYRPLNGDWRHDANSITKSRLWCISCVATPCHIVLEFLMWTQLFLLGINSFYTNVYFSICLFYMVRPRPWHLSLLSLLIFQAFPGLILFCVGKAFVYYYYYFFFIFFFCFVM